LLYIGGAVPKLKPQELETRRREIIEAARTCFLRHGFHQTTTDEICREASITPGGLYHYFSGKEQIITAVIEHTTAETVARLRAATEGPEDAGSAFRELAQFLFSTMRDPDIDNVVRLDLEVWVEGLRNEKLAKISRESWVARREVLERFIRRSAEEGLYEEPGIVDEKGLGSLLMAILIGLRVGKLVWKEDFDLNGAMRMLFMMNAGRLATKLPPMDVPSK
jgi:AcrR family transcriptional regulator